MVPTNVLALGAAVSRADIPGLCEQLSVLLEGHHADVVVCDVGAVVEPDAVVVDALARLQLTAGLRGCEVQLRHASAELRDLLALMGLDSVVRSVGGHSSG